MPVSPTAVGAIYGSGVYGTDEYGVVNDSVSVSGVSATTAVSTAQVFIVNARIQEGAEGTGVVNAGYTDKYNGFYVSTNFVNAYYGEAVYGRSYYGNTSGWTEVEVPVVVGTGAIGGVSISAASETSLSASVFAEIVTDAPGVIGDEVTVTGGATPTPSGASASFSVGTITQKTVNRIDAPSVEGTAEAGTLTVSADSNFALTASTSGTITVNPVVVLADSVVSVTGVSATGTTDENEVVRNNAIPTFTGVSATGAVTTVSVTTVRNVFDAADRNENRTVYMAAGKPRIVYVRAA